MRSLSGAPAGRRALRLVRRGLVRAGLRPAPAPAKKKPRRKPPIVSVIVPVYNVEAYLDECLQSIQDQKLRRIQIVVVNDGSTDGSLELAQRRAAQDPRILLVDQENQGLGAARNAGVREATGVWLTFVDSDDRLPPDALGQLVRAASPGGQLVVGPLARFSATRRWLPHWVSMLHSEQHCAISIGRLPELVRNNYSVGKLFRRSWWLEQDRWFRVGVAYEDQPLITELYGLARSIDVVRAPVYDYRERADGSSISQQVHTLADLRARVAAWDASWTSLRLILPEVAFNAWLLTLFDVHFHWYLESESIADPEYWDLLRGSILRLSDEAGPVVWRRTMPHHRLLVELARRDRPDLILEYLHRDGSRLERVTSSSTPDGVLLDLPFRGQADLGLPDELFLLRPEQLKLSQSLEQLLWSASDSSDSSESSDPADSAGADSALWLRLRGWAAIRFLDTTDQRTTVILRHRRSGAELTAVNDRGLAGWSAPLQPPPNNDRSADYRAGGYDVSMRLDQWLQSVGVADGDLIDVLLRVQAEGFEVVEPLSRISARGGAAGLRAGFLDRAVVAAEHNEYHPLEFRYDLLTTRLDHAVPAGRTISGELLSSRTDLVELVARPQGGDPSRPRPAACRTPLVQLSQDRETSSSGPGVRYGFELTFPTDPRPGSWQLRAVGADGAQVHIAYAGGERRGSLEPPAPTTATSVAGTPVAGTPVAGTPVAGTPVAGTPTSGTAAAAAPATALAIASTRFGRFGVFERRVGLELVTASAADDSEDSFDFTLRPCGLEDATLRVGLANSKDRSVFSSVRVPTGGDAGAERLIHVRVDAQRPQWRFGRLPLPSSTYQLVAERPEGGTVPIRVGDEFRPRMPLPLISSDLAPDHRIDTEPPPASGALVAPLTRTARLTRSPRGAVEVRIDRPIRSAESRSHDQAILERRYGPGRRPARRPAVLLQSYFGETAVCNGVGLQRELERRGAELDIYWGVRDTSVPVPAGARRVIWGSSEWYELLTSARYYLDNMFQPLWLHKSPGQVYLQTFHGYPFKTMGLPLWRRSGVSEDRIASYARRAADWDYLVSPARYATPLLTSDFGYHGEVAEVGYPRNDVLQSPEAGRIRAAVRESLGITEGQCAVLYAPTFRDYLSTDGHTARFVDFLDLDRLRAALPDAVVLVRGHAFNARTSQRIHSGDRIVDVTDYPEVADLYLAADAAVVDYSSLRFDFGVTGKPMIFHVPDLERYQETRGWLFDFVGSAPGPLVRTTEEVIGALAELSRVRSEFDPAYRAFEAEFLDLEDGRAASRLVDQVFVPRGDAPAAPED